MRFQYAIFDMDGTILDSIPFWDRLALAYLRELGVDAPEDVNSRMAELSLGEAAAFLQEEFSLKESREELLQGLCLRIGRSYREEIPLKPGARELLLRLGSRGIRMCAATASSLRLVRPALERNGVLEAFDFLLDCDLAGAGKGSPAIYEMAAKRFGAAPSDCVVVEDAAYALQTAKTAGFLTIGVFEKGEKDPERARGFSDLYIQEFSELWDGRRLPALL